MANVVLVAKPPGVQDDDEAWLYGDAENKEPSAPGTGPTPALQPGGKEEGEMSTSEATSAIQSQEKDEDDDDSDDDDDDVHVTIGDIKAFPVTGAAGNLFKPGSTYQKQPVVAAVSNKGGVTTAGAKGVDVDGEGQVNGIPLYEFTLDSLRDEDKPWRKPGADITDYFNYGFNEETWRRYCLKQTRLRMENGANIPKNYNATHPHQVKTEPDHGGHMKSFYRPPMQMHSNTGTIAVLGSTAASRRPMDEHVDRPQQIATLGSNVNKPADMGGMGMPPGPDFSIPPPGIPGMPPGMAPPRFSPAVPPPGMPVQPVPAMFSHPPPVPPPFFPPNIPPPGDGQGFGERPPFNFDPSNPQTSYPDPKSAGWDSRDSGRERYDYNKRDRSPTSGYGRDYYRGRESERPRSDRDRSRSRSRERDRRHRDRERDDKKSKRKVKEEPDDSDYYKSSSSSSKHKKSKRSKRDRDDELSDKQKDDA